MRIKTIINLWKFPILGIIYCFMKADDRELLLADLKRFEISWAEQSCLNSLLFRIFVMLIKERSFSSVMLFRLNSQIILKAIFDVVWRPLKTIELNSISGEIGPGLWVSHNYMVISVYSAGKNFRVGPGVVIGLKKEKAKKIINPVIGDDVYICANSTVVGGVKIGNNVVVCPGSVVINDIPSNCTVAGNPAKIIKKREKTYLDI